MAVLPHLLLRFSGHFFDQDQSWSVGFRFRSLTGGDPGGIADIQTKLETWRDAVRALNGNDVFPSELQALMGGQTYLTAIRAAAVGANGKETAVALVQGAPLMVGNGQVRMPNQVALAFTLDTGKPGTSNRGRVYFPWCSGVLQNSGRLDPANTLLWATQMAGFIHDIANAGASAITPGLLPVVISQVKSTATPITEVRVGDRLDIQRRRGDKQKEIYGVAPVAQ